MVGCCCLNLRKESNFVKMSQVKTIHDYPTKSQEEEKKNTFSGQGQTLSSSSNETTRALSRQVPPSEMRTAAIGHPDEPDSKPKNMTTPETPGSAAAQAKEALEVLKLVTDSGFGVQRLDKIFKAETVSFKPVTHPSPDPSTEQPVDPKPLIRQVVIEKNQAKKVTHKYDPSSPHITDVVNAGDAEHDEVNFE